jgi:hypothetical protein
MEGASGKTTRRRRGEGAGLSGKRRPKHPVGVAQLELQIEAQRQKRMQQALERTRRKDDAMERRRSKVRGKTKRHQAYLQVLRANFNKSFTGSARKTFGEYAEGSSRIEDMEVNGQKVEGEEVSGPIEHPCKGLNSDGSGA